MSVESISIFISAIATAVIAIYARKAHDLSIEIKEMNVKSDTRDERFKEQLKVLYQAIVLSNLPCAGSSTDEKLEDFKKYFKKRKNYFEGIFDNI